MKLTNDTKNYHERIGSGDNHDDDQTDTYMYRYFAG